MNRYASGHGQNMGGKDKHSRGGGMSTDMLSTMEKGFVAKEEKAALARSMRAKSPPPTPANAPEPDSGAHGLRAHVGLHGAPDVYRETPDGRKGMRGKRGA